jgi:O-antigen/teichoic acid export membrane protein
MTVPLPTQNQKDELKKRAISGSFASIIGKAFEQTVRLGTNLVLTHVLFPEAFGVMGLIMTLLIGLDMLSDLGVRISIITSRREDADFLDTAWTISIVRGVALWGLAAALAVPFAHLYNEPALRYMVPVSAFAAVFHGAKSSKVYVLGREIRVRRLIAVDVASQFLGSILMVGLALWLRSTWALVWGSLSMAGLNCLLGYVALPGHSNRFRYDRSAAHEIWHMSGWIFVSTILTFLAMRIDILLLGKLVPKSALGVYNIANSLSGLPALAGDQIIGWVLLPALASAFRENKEAMARTFKRARSAIMPAAGFVCLGVALGAPVLFYGLFDVRYRDAAWMAPLMVLGAWFHFLQEASGRALQAMGTARPLAMANAVKLVFTTAGCAVGYYTLAVPGFILGAASGALAGHVLTVILLVKADIPAGRSDITYTLGGLVLGVLGVGGPMLADRYAGVPRLIGAIAASILILGPVGLLTLRRLKHMKSSMSAPPIVLTPQGQAAAS